MYKIIALLLLLSTQAHAYEVGVIVGSRHFDTKEDYNEVNPGLYVIDDGVIAGAYKNSYSDPTVFAGWTIEHKWDSGVRVYLGYGLVYGYGWNNGLTKGAKLLPFILPTVSIRNVNIHIVGNAMALSFSRKFR